MKMQEILNTIKELARSQGFYGRLLESILELRRYDPEGYEDLVEELEKQNFQDKLDLILFLEC